MSTFWIDLRYTLRQLRRSPGFAITAVLTLGLGIGAASTMYTVVRSTLLASLPYPRSGELVGVGFSQPGASANAEQTGESADFLQAHANSFAKIGIADDGPLGANFSVGDGRATTIRSLRVSSGYLPTLEQPVLLGRTFTGAEDTPGAAPTVVLSESLWRHALNADPAILGRPVHINGDPYTVIGVVPSISITPDAPDLWQPLQLAPSDPGYYGTNYQLIARLKSGVSVAQASAELGPLTEALFRQFPRNAKMGPPGAPLYRESSWPLQRVVVSGAQSSLKALSGAVAAVLLMACFNLAGLVTARSAARRSEIALRAALGAPRSAVLRLLLSESFVLALAGSLLGLVLAALAVPVLVRLSPVVLPQLRASAISGPIVALAILTGMATTLFFGLLPALSVFRSAAGAHLGGMRTAGTGAPQQRLGRILAIFQVALATVLLSASTLLLGTFLHMRALPSGVRPQHLFALQVNLKGAAYASSEHSQQFVSTVEDRLRQIPGVEHVAAVNGLPLDRGLNNSGGPVGHPGFCQSRFITPGYFRTVGTMLLTGSDISAGDNATAVPVALINERAANLWFPGRSPLGEYVVSGGGKPLRVIGMVTNGHASSLVEGTQPTIYLPYAQVSSRSMKMINGWFPTTFVLRTHQRGGSADPDLSAAAAAAVTAVDPEVPVSKFAPMQTFIDRTVAAPRFFSWLAGGFAAFALLLTIIGLFGLLSYQVIARTRELGVRLALGAPRPQILALVLGNGLRLTSIGLFLGIAVSLALERVLSALISDTAQVAISDLQSVLSSRAVSLSVAAIAMLSVATAASLIPAYRAATIEPTEALRSE